MVKSANRSLSITSTKNPLVKSLKKLQNSQGRREQKLLLLEGTNLLAEACAVDYPLVTVCCTLEWQQSHPQLWEKAVSRCHRAELVTPEVINAIATTVNPDGIVATAKRPATPSSLQLPTSLGLALETVQDPGNLGTMIRTGAGAGADGLWLSSDSVDIDNPKVLRSSAGQWFRLPVTVCPDLKELVCQCQDRGIQIVATLPDATLTYWELDWRVPTLILLGNEAGGLRTELTELADQQVKIPLWRGVESLNVAIAASLMLYEAQRQRLVLR